MITASEWYRESRARDAEKKTRDHEPDAAQADAEGEKVFD